MPNPFLPYGRQALDQADIDAVVSVLKSDYLTTGPEIPAFEEDFKVFVKSDHAIACNSATAALHLVLAGLGVGPGDLCIVPTITFLATANAVRYCGAEVVFCDVDPQSGLMTPETFEAAITRASGPVKVILPVHLGGSICDMKALRSLADQHGAYIVEDACHAIGGQYDGDGRVGDCRYSEASTFSFHPVKTLTSGEGGMVTTRNADLADWITKARSHGVERASDRFIKPDHGDEPWYYEMAELGWNYRMPDILAALGRSQLAKMPQIICARRDLTQCYQVRLAAGDDRLRAPDVNPQDCRHLMNVRLDFERLGKTRIDVMAGLRDLGIGSQVHYVPVHTQPYYEGRYGVQTLPGADTYYAQTLSLPLYPQLTACDVDRVLDSLARVLEIEV